MQVVVGKTNKEVAVPLFLSTKTIEFHLTRVTARSSCTHAGSLIGWKATEKQLKTTRR